MTLRVTSIAVAALLAVSLAKAQTEAPKAPEPNYTVSYNIGVTSDYRYRGISQSGLKPALQGGIDFAHKNGFYVGTWASTIRWIKDQGRINNVDTGSSPIELDIYGGYKFEAAKDVTLDFGALQYVYMGNRLINVAGSSNANTLEFYGAATVGIFTAKYSRSQTNLFGTGLTTNNTNSRGSGYLDLSAAFDFGNGYSMVPHVGYQKITNNTAVSYTDYSVTLNKDINGLVLSVAGVGTSTRSTPNLAYPSAEGRNLGKGAMVVSVKKNF